MSERIRSRQALGATGREIGGGWWVLGPAIVLGALGAVIGLVVGLQAYWKTAPFAMLELGVPAAILGAFVGAVAFLVCSMAERVRTRGQRS